MPFNEKMLVVGQVVRLRLGGPLMFVEFVEKSEKGRATNRVCCSWFDKDGILQTKVFLKELLMSYPLSAFHFIVEWGGTQVGFQEVSGLSAFSEVTEYREGNSPNLPPRKMPGIVKYTNIVLKRGLTKGDNQFYQWFTSRQVSSIERRDITISLLGEEHQPVFVWRVKNAFPVKISYGPLNSMSSEIVVETLEVAHEGLIVETA